MTRVEASVMAVGFALFVVALAAVDWRLGLAAAGLGLMGSTLDLRGDRR